MCAAYCHAKFLDAAHVAELVAAARFSLSEAVFWALFGGGRVEDLEATLIGLLRGGGSKGRGFPKVPESSLGILRVPQLPPPPLNTAPPLKNPTITLIETNSNFAPENPWLEDDSFPFGAFFGPIFEG